MTKTKTLAKAPFRADHVGSLLRPENLHKRERSSRWRYYS